ncbi:insecticidal toxin complex protein TccC [Pseudomonas sp. IT-P44]|uniref:RHS repeat-associated core domain-containing protein n=1 Tax=Pseudomonas sp. IT-P44 TaxID=3026451 RepID=UPI0039E0F333
MNAHPHTPTLSVMDPRALAIREVGYCRHPDENVIASRITRQVFDAAGRSVESSDSRLWASAQKPNLVTVHGLSGHPLLTDSVDAGWQLSLLNQAGSLRSFRDARGSQRHIAYDDQQRPIAVTEQAADALPHVVERLTYGGSAPAFAVHNQCAKLIRHDNPASTRFVTDYGLPGSQLGENQRFLIDLEPPDWPSELEARDALLEDQSFVTRHVFSPSGEIQRQTDAMGNDRTFVYDVAGRLSETWLLMAGEGRQPQCLVSDILYNTHDQIESEIAGNGVKTQAEYGADDGRLIRLMAALGSQKTLQDLNYTYDPAGNITELEDKAQAVTWFNNQRIEPINRYRYDSLSQLVEASGWEVANPSHGPALPDLLPTPLDPNQRRNYTQRFEYDAAGNLITRQHSGAPGFSMFTSARSNRSLAQRDDGSLPGEPEIESGFDVCGNQLELQRGQAMTWDIRNQLSRVTLVKREDDPDDYECYAYDRPGHRLRKVHFNQTRGRTGRTEVRYLPGLELHRQSDGKEHHVISIEAGRCSVRALHWPEGAHADQLRYSLCDHLGSSTLELDHEACVLTQEYYYPFGGTACWAGESALVAKYKTIRYSGKERDATGLYYYGFRYYAPWLQRWICSDPAGLINGPNLYCMLGNNVLRFKDAGGLVKVDSVNMQLQKIQGLPELLYSQDHIDNASLVTDLSRSNEVSLLDIDGYRVVYKNYAEMWTPDDEMELQRIRANNEVFAFRLSEQLGLDFVPETALVQERRRAVVSRYIQPVMDRSACSMGFNREKTSLYVFDYLIDIRDRDNEGSNVVFDEAGKFYAIDHEQILGLGSADSRPKGPGLELGDAHLSIFFENSIVVEKFNETDWPAFYDEHTNGLDVADPLEIQRSKNAFLARVDRVRTWLSTSP